MRIAALGRTQMLVDTIDALRSAGHDVVLIGTCEGVGRSLRPEDFESLARRIRAEFVRTQRLDDPAVVARLTAARADVAVSVDWVNLIGRAAIDAFPLGILNAHAGDLPRYRGNAPVAWAIINDEKEVALTIHRMDPRDFDSGPIVCQDRFALSDAVYIGHVFSWIESRVPALFSEAVTLVAADPACGRPQSTHPAMTLRCFPRLPEDGAIDWRTPAAELARLVRATAEPFAGAYAQWPAGRLIIWRAAAREWETPFCAVPGQVMSSHPATGEVAVATGDGVLVLQEVETERDGRCAAATLISSVRIRLQRGLV